MSKLVKDYLLTSEELTFPYESCLSGPEQEMLRKNSNIVKYKNKDIIFRQFTRTSHIMLINSGYVKIFKEGRNGKIIILKVGTRNNFLGLMSVFGNDIHQYSASAIDAVDICFIDISIFKEIIMRNGKFALNLLKTLSLEGLFIFERLMSQSHKQLPGRIADVLLYFSETIYKSHIFNFPFTRRELAELAGTTKESFIRTLTEFKNDKIIDLDGARVEINSLKIIKTLSELG
jgi:CRP/FNR family transcriptional regulator, polysaccharide utilization system transcription regulator